MPILVPDFLEKKLEQNRSLRAVVDGVTADFSAWFKDSRTPFFPDYTDHGPDHVSSVLQSAVELMSSDAKEIITSNDAAVLTIAAILHDSAMHISEDGFYSLIKGEASKRKVGKFDTRSWPDLWDEFLYSAKRWDDNQLTGIFGKKENGAPLAHVEDPFLDYGNLTECHKKLIGEFLRRHHPRLAHEIALFGVPTTNKSPIQLAPRFESDIADIAGLVARSHGLPLRKCIDYLAAAYHRREYQGIHAVYLMAVLRVADYLQIDSSRAPGITFQYRKIPSRISVLERRTHAAVKNITATHDDPESLLVQAQPDDIHVYLRLRSWLAGIQSELDSSWAVLGEVYGANSALSKLGLKLRRIRSNLIDDENFSRSLPFVAERIRFDVARAELLTLLIRPLYGNRPDIGVREILQNSIDAVLERKDAELRGAVTYSDYRKQEADIVIWIEEPDSSGSTWLRISDKGIGMTEEVVRDYFLRAGASFRRSDAWRQDFEETPSGKATSGVRSRVLRSGRFGVGALAAFLLGEELEVTTRHVSRQYGIRFRTNLEAEAIHIEKCPLAPVGTEIRVRLSQHALSDLKNSARRVERPGRFDWFCYGTPTCIRIIGKTKTRLKQRYQISIPDNGTITNWRSLPSRQKYRIFWSFQDAPSLTCNGLFVNNSGTLHDFSEAFNSQGCFGLRRPNIAIVDPDAEFPLTLQRTQCSLPEYPFEAELALGVIHDFIAWLLSYPPKPDASGIIRNCGWHPGLMFRYGFPHFATTGTGLMLVLPGSLQKLSAEHVCLLDCGHGQRVNEAIEAIECDATIYLTSLDWLIFAKDDKDGNSITFSHGGAKITGLKGIRLIIPKSYQSPLSGLGKTETCIEREVEQWKIVATNGCPRSKISFDFSKAPKKEGGFAKKIGACELFLDSSFSFNIGESILSREWKRLMGDEYLIPFDLEERRRKFQKAYKNLAAYCSVYEAQQGF